LREGELYTEIWLGVMGERDHLADLGVDGKIILKWFFKELDGGRELKWCGSS
jgi:hypothetical protein